MTDQNHPENSAKTSPETSDAASGKANDNEAGAAKGNAEVGPSEKSGVAGAAKGNADTKDEWEIDNLPNRLTMFRMLLIPIIVGSLILQKMTWMWTESIELTLGYIAAWTFVLASVTDFFDGYIARKRGIVTVFGSFLDPIADKFLVVSSLILLGELERIPSIVVLILVLREMYITSLRLLASERGLAVPVGKLGKWKTATQMVGIPLLMANDHPWGIPMPLLGTIGIYLASIFSLYSALEYSVGLVKKIKAKKEAQRAHSSR